VGVPPFAGTSHREGRRECREFGLASDTVRTRTVWKQEDRRNKPIIRELAADYSQTRAEDRLQGSQSARSVSQPVWGATGGFTRILRARGAARAI
jgi:hypothetical protein